MTIKLPLDRSRAFRLAGALVGLSVALGACKHTGDVAVADREHSATIIACGIRSPSRKPTARS